MTTKNRKCSKCSKEKTIKSFYKQRNGSDGYQSWCKLCMRNLNRSHYKKKQKKAWWL